MRDAITLAIALFGAALGLFNTYRAVRRDRPRVVINAQLEELGSGAKRLRVDVINAGHVAVFIKDVALLSANKAHPHPPVIEERPTKFPYQLQPGAALTITSRADPAAFNLPFMRQVYGVVAWGVDGRRYMAKCRALRDHATQLKAAARLEQAVK